MKSQYFIALLVLFLATLVSGCSKSIESVNAELSKQVELNAKKHGIPGQAVLVMHNDAEVFRKYTGVKNIETKEPIGNDSIFPIFSVGKLFASTLVMQLSTLGQLTLSDPIVKYVPWLPESWHDIKVEQFLNHSSGIPEYYVYKNGAYNFPSSLEIAIKNLNDVPLSFEPGSEVRYNQTNYLVIKLLIESITGTSYRELVESRILKPFKLNETYLGKDALPLEKLVSAYLSTEEENYQAITVDFPDYAISLGDVYTSLDDLKTFLSAVVQGNLVPKDKLLELWLPHLLNNGDETYFASGWDYGSSGFWHEIGHDGSALLRVRILFKESLTDTYIFIYLTNGNKDGVWSRTLVDSIQDKLVSFW